ncbi:MAG: hypothetical protein IPH62_04530 [Ignavibacteriae bacterium]|nr:hypothetical protein [Ignavibacteriota bacterium]
MEFINTYAENYLKEDFVAETDSYISMLEIEKKRDLFIKIVMGTVYVVLLFVSVIVV